LLWGISLNRKLVIAFVRADANGQHRCGTRKRSIRTFSQYLADSQQQLQAHQEAFAVCNGSNLYDCVDLLLHLKSAFVGRDFAVYPQRVCFYSGRIIIEGTSILQYIYRSDSSCENVCQRCDPFVVRRVMP
jgi:hypothetical protein